MRRTPWGRRVLAGLALTFAQDLGAQVTRRTVTVEVPAGLSRMAAEMAADARARSALVEAEIGERLSATLLESRGPEVRTAIGREESVLSDFAVISRQRGPGESVFVTCEATVDLGAAFVQLVRAGVVSFDDSPPRVLMVPGVRTDPASVRAVGARVRETLAGAGFQFMDAASIGATRDPAALKRAGVDVLVTLTLQLAQPSSAVGGVILDGGLQVTATIPENGTIVLDRIFTGRASGATRLVAQQSLIAELGPKVAGALATDITRATFAERDLVDPAPSRPIEVRAAPRVEPSPTPRVVTETATVAEATRPPMRLSRRLPRG